MPRSPELPALPPGSDRVAAWARQRRLTFEPHPDEAWFHAWEPYDTLVSAGAYFNAVSWTLGSGSVTVAEPWYAPVGSEPLDRTWLSFVSHARFMRRAAARGGEHFNTRVAFVQSAPPPTVTLGDPEWDRHLLTFAASGSEAVAAFPPSARRVLQAWRFAGHIEVRPGGLVLHVAGLQPTPEALERLYAGLPELVRAFVG